MSPIANSSQIPQRNEVDRFGFSYILAKLTGVCGNNGVPKRALCSWQHGWKWYPPYMHQLHIDGKRSIRHKTHVVNHFADAEILSSKHSFKHVVAGGLPFAYVLKYWRSLKELGDNERFDFLHRDICVVLPKCGYETDSVGRLISFVKQDSSLTSRSVLLVFGGDLENNDLMALVSASGIPWICGSSPAQSTDLIRTKELLSSFDYMITNSLGSHIAYGAALGHKIMLTSGSRIRTTEEFLASAPGRHFGYEYCEAMSEVNKLEYFLSRYSDKFRLNEFSGNLESWGNLEIGLDRTLDVKTLPELVGWTWSGKLRCAREAGTRMVESFFLE